MLKRFLDRSYLTLFLGSFFFVVNAQQPVLEAVSVDTIFPQQIKITWLYDKDIDSVTIYKCTQNCNTNTGFNWNEVAKLEMIDLEWIDSFANPLSQNYYSVGWKSSGMAVPQNNMVLKAISALDGCQNSISLSWNPYINIMEELDHYNVFYRKADTDTSFFKWLASTNENLFTAKLLENIEIYEFVIQAINKTNTASAFSNIMQDTTGTVIDSPVAVKITHVSVIEDRDIEIVVKTDDIPDPHNLRNLFLFRAKEMNNPNYDIIDSLPYSFNNTYFFTDEDADPHSGLYYYQAIAYHQCKTNDYSNILSNIFLTGHRAEEERYKDSIIFYQKGADLSETYDLLINGNSISTLFQLTVENNRYLVDVERFMKEGSELVFQIKSTTDCYSNTLVIPHEPIVKFPTAFYPNGSVVDKTFYPIIYFPSEEDYLFIIYNRWGQELYRSTLPPIFEEYKNNQGRWDGTFQGKECAAEVYAYKLSFKYNNGKGKYSNTGSFMLVR